MTNEGISVVIPVNNAESYIEDCINSVSNQTYDNLEIICINDGSKDNSLLLLQDLAAKDQRIKIVDEPNRRGASHARNIGIELSSKKYIAFIDADDTIEPTMYETLYRLSEENALDCACCGYKVFPYKGATKLVPTPFGNGTVLRNEEIINKVVRRIIGFSVEPNDGLSALWNKLFLAENIKDNNIIINEKRTHGEDWQFCIEFYAKCKSMGFSGSCFYHYIHHSENSLVSRFRPNAFELSVESSILFRALFPQLPWEAELKQNEVRMSPVKAALYYRLNSKSNTMEPIYIDMMRICKTYQDFLFQYEIKHSWEKDLRQSIVNEDVKLFADTLEKLTDKDHKLTRLKHCIKKMKSKIIR